MVDDWSLKDKRKWIFASSEYGDPILDISDDDENNFEDTWIHIKDIDTLRLRLIEDVFDFTDDITVVSRQVFIKQINKRFGVNFEKVQSKDVKLNVKWDEHGFPEVDE